MDPESKKLLEDTLAIAKENNRMLLKIRSVQRWASFMSWVKIIVIVGITLGAFYFIEPYLNKIIGMYNSVTGTQQKINANDLLNKL